MKKLMKRNVLLRDAETNQWLNKDLELYPIYVAKGSINPGNIQNLDVVHTTFKGKTNALIAWLKGGSTEEFSGLKLAVRLSETQTINVAVKTTGESSLFDLLLQDWKGRVPTVEVYGEVRPDFKKMLEKAKFAEFLTMKMEGLHQHLKSVRVSFSKEHDIPENWRGETYENKLITLPEKVVAKLPETTYHHVL